MSTTISLNVTQPRLAPRAAASIGDLFAAALAMIMPAADRPAAPRDPAREAARVRAMAQNYVRTDPRFASELFAAADRHEALYSE